MMTSCAPVTVPMPSISQPLRLAAPPALAGADAQVLDDHVVCGDADAAANQRDAR